MDRGAWQATAHGVKKSRTWLDHLVYLSLLTPSHLFLHLLEH